MDPEGFDDSGVASVSGGVLDYVIPAWTAGIRFTWTFPDASSTVDAGNPYWHDGDLHLHVLWSSVRS